MMKRWSVQFSLILGALVLTGLAPANSSDFVAPPSPTAGWLETMNFYRSASGLKPVTESQTLTSGVLSHVTYLAKTDPLLISGLYLNRHSENPASPYATRAGITTGAGDLTSGPTSTESEPIDEWMSAPFHAVALLRENLLTTGFAEAFNANSGQYEQGLSVLSGLGSAKRTKNILFPGPNSKVRLNVFSGENPDPRESCGSNWKKYQGLPIWASLTSTPSRALTATLVTPSGAVLSARRGICIVDKWNFKTSNGVYGPTGKAIIASDNLVIIIPKARLAAGKYRVKISSPGHHIIGWSFAAIAPLPSQILLAFATSAAPHLYTWHPVTGSADDTVLGYEVIVTNKIGLPPQTFKVTGTSFDDSAVALGAHSICVRATGTTRNSPCAWYSITKSPN
jgi:hypothetical protein